MARRSLRRCIRLLTPKPSSRSSSVSPSRTCGMFKERQTMIATEGRKVSPTGFLPPMWPYLSALDILWAGADVHGHRHDNLKPGLHGARPPLGHGCGPGQLHLLEAVQLVLPVWQAEAVAGGAGEAVRVWVGRVGGEGEGWHVGDVVEGVSEGRGGSGYSERWENKMLIQSSGGGGGGIKSRRWVISSK